MNVHKFSCSGKEEVWNILKLKSLHDCFTRKVHGYSDIVVISVLFMCFSPIS